MTQMTDDGIPTTVVPIVSGDLADAVLARLDPEVREQVETPLRNAFAAEEQAVRNETIKLGSDHE